MQEFDVIIVGAGPAGMAAGIFASRRAMKTLIISPNIGGQMLYANYIENYPGFKKIKATELVKKFEEHVKSCGVSITKETVVHIKEEREYFIIETDTTKYKTKAVILAFGKSPRRLGVPGEREYTGKGVSYCATCDAPLFKNVPVAVIGGGNSAFEAAHILSKFASHVYLIHRSKEFRAFQTLIEKVRKKVHFILDSEVEEIKGDKFVNSIVIKDKNGNKKELKVRGVFVEIGSEVKTDLIEHLVKIDENGQVVVNERNETFYPNSNKIRPGIFAAGDLTNTPFKQIITSAAEGCRAALQAYNYIYKLKGPAMSDWSI